MTRETWVIARGILIDAGIEPAWAKVKTGEQYLVRDAEVVQVRRATLQEAARAVCNRCAQEFPERDDQSCDYWHPPAPYGSILCDASAIHDLIAALDKGGDR